MNAEEAEAKIQEFLWAKRGRADPGAIAEVVQQAIDDGVRAALEEACKRVCMMCEHETEPPTKHHRAPWWFHARNPIYVCKATGIRQMLAELAARAAEGPEAAEGPVGTEGSTGETGK